MHSLLEELQALELELHHPGVRCTQQRLEQLLYPDFHEVGRSGQAYDRATVIACLAARGAPPAVESGEFRVASVTDEGALLTYRSRQRQIDGSVLSTWRSS